MIDQLVHESSNSTAGGADPIVDGQYKKPHVSIGTNQTTHVMAAQFRLKRRVHSFSQKAEE